MTGITPPAWDRRQLAGALHAHDELRPALQALGDEDWMRAHQALGTYFNTRPARFVIAPDMRPGVAAAIAARFPASAGEASARADRMLAGRYDLLGYRDLPFDGASWHRDVVHDKTVPLRFWSTVPYLDPSCGDHKVIWEFNRHQHWMELGRAYWLTGDERYRTACLGQLASWLAANPPLMGVNWASVLELGFRAISWIWALHFFALPDREDRSPWLVDLLLALDRQLTHIERHLSYYFSPNTHLLGEALALYVAGRTLPALRASARREATGRRILVQEIGRQIMADGGHCERSTHYHRYTLDFYLLALAVARVTGDPIAGTFERACARLAEAGRALADDGGRLPHIGDDDGGSLLPITRRATDDARDSLAIAATLTGRTHLLVDGLQEEVWWMLSHPSFADGIARIERAPRPVAAASVALPATGYYISRRDGDHLVVDSGPHGYMNAGHAHADALSLTFTRRGTPLLIDTGTGCYTVDPAMRDRFRSTALHNTLALDARSQSIPRGPFHWRHMAHGSTRRWHVARRFDYFAGTHDGYLPLIHARHVLLVHGDVLVVADAISCAPDGVMAHQQAHVAVHWHFDPAWTVTPREDGALLQTADQSVDLAVSGGAIEHFRGDEETGLGWHAPVYGFTQPTSTLRIAATGVAPFWIVSAFGLDAANPLRAVTLEPLSGREAFQWATAIRIERARSSDCLIVAEPGGGPARGRLWRTAEVESDAAMLFTRAVGGAITDYLTLDEASAAPLGAATPAEHGRGLACAESLDSLMVRQ